jgi:autotransporter-associated beta strand protein
MKLLRNAISSVALLGFCTAVHLNAGVINNDSFYKDTSGNPIYAQGGGVFKFNGTWYWYGVKYNGAVTYYNNPSAGENADTSFNAFSCYSSSNLVDWKFENTVMTSSTPGLEGSGWVGRMGVAYNSLTQKYVLLSQFTGNNGSGILFATCDTPTGNFVYDHIQTSVPIVNNMTGDQSLFLDDDGTAYLICSSANGRAHQYVLPLHPADYLNVDAGDNAYNQSGREGNMMLKNNGHYYFCSSDLHGWNASHCYVVDSTNILGTYSAEYIMNRTDLDFCHVSQTGFGVTVTGTNGTTTIFVGDRWCDFAGNGVGYNQWIPVSFNGSTPTFESLSQYDLNAAAGTWSVLPGNNFILNPGFEADRVSQTNVAGWNSTGSGFGNAAGSHNPGNWHFRHSNISAYTATTDQLVTGLTNGTYTLSAWYESSGGQATARIFARNFGGAEMDTNVSMAQASWTQVVIPKIPVTNGQCDVGLYSVASANQSVDMDDWSLTIAGPPPPTGLTAASGNAQAILNWASATSATAYNVKRSTINGGPYTIIATPAANNYTDTSVANGTTYFYVVSATNALGESPDSAQASVVPSAGPIIVTASANPNPAFPGQSVTISATVTVQANPIGAITVDVSAIGGVTNQTLVSDGTGKFTNTVTVNLATPIGSQVLTVNGRDNVGNVSAPYSFSLTVGSVNATWDGNASDNNWSSGANWAGNTPPGIGYTLIFAGLNRLTPVMDGSYNIYAANFDSTAGNFNIGTSGGTLTLTGGVNNNSANAQILNVPVALGAPATISAASGDLTLGQSIGTGTNLLTITDGGHNIVINGVISGSGGLVKDGPGTNTLSGVNTFSGNITISNGTLAIAGSGELGAGVYSDAITDNGTLAYNSTAAQTLTGAISGSGGLNLNGSGSLTLGTTNLFGGPTILSGGTLQISNALALQNSTLTYNGGNFVFNGLTAATLGGLSGAQNLSLLNNAAAAVALTVSGNNSNTIFSGGMSGSGASLTKAGTGTLTLAGNNSYTSTTTVSAGTLELSAGGAINCGPLSGAGFLVDGGTLISSGTTSFSALNNAWLQTAGVASLGDVTEPNSDGLLVKITGGTFSATSLTLRRTAIFTTAPTATSPIAAATTTGLYINGATASVNLGALTVGTGNSSDTVRVDAGNVIVTNEVLIGHTSNTRWEILQVNGGSFTSLDAINGIVLSQNSGTTPNNSELYVSGGMLTAEKIAFGVATDTVGGNGFLIANGGSLFVGSGGIVRSNTTGYTSTISLINGTLGAKADWASALPMQLNGASYTFAAADALGAAHNISLNNALQGAGGLIKTGAGVLNLNGTNTYTGSTTVNAGTLLVNGSLAGGPVGVASGGTLGGTGVISGAVTVNAGGTMAPGGLGKLTVNNNLTLAGGSSTAMQVQHSPRTNSSVTISGSLTNGGTLLVNGGLDLAAGDTFKLFNAASYFGTFTNVILPVLHAGLGWNTSLLNSSGTISVIVIATPVINSASMSGNHFVLSGTGGLGSSNFYLLGSTNLGAPVTNWTRLQTNQFDAIGNFTVTNTINPAWLQTFYRLQLQ